MHLRNWRPQYVCLCVCVCLSVREDISGTNERSLIIFVHVAYGRGSVLLRRRCDTLCTFEFDAILYSLSHVRDRFMAIASRYDVFCPLQSIGFSL